MTKDRFWAEFEEKYQQGELWQAEKAITLKELRADARFWQGWAVVMTALALIETPWLIWLLYRIY